MTETRDKVIIEYASVNFDKTANDVKTLKGNLEGITEVSFNTEKSTASLENKFASLERRFQTTAAQTAQYAKIQKDVNLAVANNPALQDRANEVLKAAEARYLGSGVAVKALAEAHKGLDAQGQAAFHSIRSLTEQLLAGQISTASFAQQIGHLSYAASGQGGLAGAFGQVATMARGMINPLNLAIGTTAILTAAAAALANQYDKVSVSSQRALGGAGQRTGTSVGDLNAFTSQNASLTGLSSKDARSLGEDFTKTGDIVISRLHGMGDAVVGFANQAGKSIDEAKKDFVSFAVDPKKGLEELERVYGNFDIATRKAVDALVLADDKTGALQVMFDALAEKSKKAADNMTLLEKAGRVIANGWNSTDFAKPAGLDGQVEAARAKLNSAVEQGNSGNPVDRGFAAQDVAKLSREFETLYAAQQKVKDQQIAAEFNKLSTAADGADKAIIPQIAQLEQLQAKLEELNRAKAGGATSKYGADVDAVATQAYQNQITALKESQAEAARYNIEVANISTSWGNVGQSTAMQLQAMQNSLPVAQQWTESGRMKAQYEATYLDLINKGKTAEEAGALAAKQYETSKAAAVASAEKLVQSSQDNLDKIQAQGTGMEGVVASTIAYRDAMQAGATQTQAAAIAANTLAASMAQAAQSAAQAEQQAYNKANAADSNGVTSLELQRQYTHASTDPLRSGRDLSFAPNPMSPVTYGQGTGRNLDLGVGGTKGSLITQQAQASMALYQQLLSQAGGLAGYTLANSGGDIDAAISKVAMSGASNVTSQLSTLYQLKNSQTDDKGAQIGNDKAFLSWLQTQPKTLENLQAMASLTTEIKNLAASTDNLNATNQELLSPYYAQDPRTSHIGFRSQGMATGGWVDVPGAPSANDNMIAQIPVAGGERIYVDPNKSARGIGDAGNSQIIQVTNHITIQGNADKNEVGRTMYQVGQTMAKQLQAAQR